MGRVLPQKSFSRDTEKVAKLLLGSFLCRKVRKKIIRGKIMEVEVYDGFRDRASHASRGKTERNAVMFGEAGVWYVYFTYGMHWMLNIVTREKGYPAAILIRAVQFPNSMELWNGPARVTKRFRIDGKLNGKPAEKKSGLWIESGEKIPGRDIIHSARVGVNYAGPYWTRRKRRLHIKLRS